MLLKKAQLHECVCEAANRFFPSGVLFCTDKSPRLSTVDGLTLCTFCSKNVTKILITYHFQAYTYQPSLQVLWPEQHKIGCWLWPKSKCHNWCFCTPTLCFISYIYTAIALYIHVLCVFCWGTHRIGCTLLFSIWTIKIVMTITGRVQIFKDTIQFSARINLANCKQPTLENKRG